MISYKPSELTAETDQGREWVAALETSLSRLHQAKRMADESLRRAQDAPGPHTSENSIFVALWETHLADREMLFSAMRQLDHARQAPSTGGEPAPGRAD